MKLQIDRDLAVPLGVQLRGLIEYGIACGELRVGERLPSVRELADAVGVAPMTVSQVYRELKAAELIETRVGSGTFVADSSHATVGERGAADLDRSIDMVIEAGLAMGLRPGDLLARFSTRIFSRPARPPRTRIVMIGMFQAATQRYARLISGHIGPAASVDAATLDAIRRDPELRLQVASADLAVTFANRLRDVEEQLPDTPVVAISFIPSEETRLALASLDPLARVGIVSLVPEFLPIMRSGVQRFAPHVQKTFPALLDGPELEAAVAEADVIVYATGGEAVLDRLRPGLPAIEYRHIPDPTDIERIVAPFVRGRTNAQPPLEKEAS
jgi:DNA-binding transcriptional regulator YhcF (GntR family)